MSLKIQQCQIMFLISLIECLPESQYFQSENESSSFTISLECNWSLFKAQCTVYFRLVVSEEYSMLIQTRCHFTYKVLYFSSNSYSFEQGNGFCVYKLFLFLTDN